MIAQLIARRYAHALFDAASQRGIIDAGYEQLADLHNLIAADPTLMNFLTAPQVLDESKRDVVRKLFCNRMHQLFVEFLIVLINKHRVGYLLEIIAEYIDRVEKAKGIVCAKVTTAVALGAGERDALIKRLEARSGHKVRLDERVDPAIIGGIIVIMHDEIIDGSIRHGLGLIEEHLMKVKVG